MGVQASSGSSELHDVFGSERAVPANNELCVYDYLIFLISYDF